MTIFEPYISVYPLEPPLPGGFRFGAKVELLIRNPGPHAEPVYPRMHEHRGKTEAEAKALARKEADDWIAVQLAVEAARRGQQPPSK